MTLVLILLATILDLVGYFVTIDDNPKFRKHLILNLIPFIWLFYPSNKHL